MSKGSVTRLNATPQGSGPVIYWMSRDQRIDDNPALQYAQGLAMETKSPLIILFCLSQSFLGATLRQYSFMLEGLKELETKAAQLGIPFIIRSGNPPVIVHEVCRELHPGSVVSDFSPLKLPRQWKEQAMIGLDAAFYEVDAHNVVPCRLASDKQEYSARTIRPKIIRLLPAFLKELPKAISHPIRFPGSMPQPDWTELGTSLQVDRSAVPVSWINPGERAARAALDNFLRNRLSRYTEDKNDPNKEAVSDLSPYLHFGQLSPLRVALEVQKKGGTGAEAFLEELIVRRELAENFCFYNPRYDQFSGLPAWGCATLRKHWDDSREHFYSLEAFEQADTHDPLWNAAQSEMVIRGKMHGYMRMYWAKKILEWSRDPEEAFFIALHLNDKYELDGRDPNGYTGIAWSIGGLHDRPWADRPVFGTIRYMNAAGCRRKFDTEQYIKKMASLKS